MINKKTYQTMRVIILGCFFLTSLMKVDAASRADTSADKQSESASHADASDIWRFFIASMDTKKLQKFVRLSAPILFAKKNLSEVSVSLDQFVFGLSDNKQLAIYKKLVKKIEVFVKRHESLNSRDEQDKKKIAISINKLNLALIPLMQDMLERFNKLCYYYNLGESSLVDCVAIMFSNNNLVQAALMEKTILQGQRTHEERHIKNMKVLVALLERAKALLKQVRPVEKAEINIMDID